jgi:uncharacterized membrane protein YhfC
MLYLTFPIQFLLMLGLPMGLWLFLRHRFSEVNWSLIGVGALTFVLSQVFHLPVNWALGLLGGGRGVALWPRPWMAAVAGLSAGVFEEGARYLVLRYWKQEARSWAAGLGFGAGHGGVEAIIIGALVLLTFINMVTMRAVPLETLGISGEMRDQVQAQVDAYWSMSWYMPLLGGAERVFALTIQIALATLVMQVFLRHNLIWLLIAILAHAVVDAVAVWGMQKSWSFLALEGLLLCFALGGLAVIWGFKNFRESEENFPGS